MQSKDPVLLIVLVEAARLRWFAAGLGMDGEVIPLLRSEDDDLALCRIGDLEQKLTFLRHRLCGVLQRACDRLWARELKPCQFVFLFPRPLDDGDLTQQLADHFVQWLIQPPVVVYAGNVDAVLPAAFTEHPIAGDIDSSHRPVLQKAIPALLAAAADENCWEISPRKK